MYVWNEQTYYWHILPVLMHTRNAKFYIFKKQLQCCFFIYTVSQKLGWNEI